MRRFYAFAAGDLSPAVKTQLERVEDAVESQCTTARACDKMLNKIAMECESFDGHLRAMMTAARECQAGTIDQATMSATIAPHATALKQLARNIGVAAEGDTLTEDDLKDSKDYLEGSKEIVEAKKSETDDDDDKGGKDGDDDDGEKKGKGEKGGPNDKDDDGKCDHCGSELEDGEECGKGCESFMIGGAAEAFGYEGVKEMDDETIVKQWVAHNKDKLPPAATSAEASSQLDEAKKQYDEQMGGESGAPQLKKATIEGVPCLICTAGGKLQDVQFYNGGKKNKVVGRMTLRAEAAKWVRRDKRAAKKGGDGAGAPAPESFTEFVDACESFMIGGSESLPFLFN